MKKSFLGLSVLLFASLIYVIALYPHSKTEAQDVEVAALTGYAWSGYECEDDRYTCGIGWIRLNCKLEGDDACAADGGVDYGVEVDLSKTGDDTISGHAWSSNIGWIDFDPDPDFDTYSNGYPESPFDEARVEASVNCSSGFEVKGWIRACSVFDSPDSCSGALNPNRGDWDGWIKMAGTVNNPAKDHYGVCISPDMQSLGGSAQNEKGYAWGGDEVVGWIEFDPNENSLEKVNNRREVIPQ